MLNHTFYTHPCPHGHLAASGTFPWCRSGHNRSRLPLAFEIKPTRFICFSVSSFTPLWFCSFSMFQTFRGTALSVLSVWSNSFSDFPLQISLKFKQYLIWYFFQPPICQLETPNFSNFSSFPQEVSSMKAVSLLYFCHQFLKKWHQFLAHNWNYVISDQNVTFLISEVTHLWSKYHCCT